MTIELRTLSRDEHDRWYERLILAFGGVPEPPQEQRLMDDLTEFDRSIGAWDGTECVGTASAFSYRVAVPGGAFLPAAGVTMVSVAATHRRRGVLTSMMRRQLDDVRARGEALAVLTASEPAIYGRFGYGIATRQLAVTLESSRVRIEAPDGTDEVALRFADVTEAAERCEAVYARTIGTRPGNLARSPGWERLPLLDPPEERNGASPMQCVLAERAGELVGFVRFHIKPDYAWSVPTGRIQVRHVSALDPAAYAALWRFLLSVDLTEFVEARNLPVDDPLLSMVSDIRRCAVRMRDSMHVRLVEVGAALAERTYLTPVDVVFEVEDAFCPWNAGRWRLTGDAKGASCERTDDAAELSLSVRELGAAYLGDTSLAALAGAGRVRELRQGALAEASVAFGTTVAPWLQHGF
ncbi:MULTISPECIES: GNAT family N-acetyltransferase [unclassified Streptomyces]|uniref:GNAT family N-acetyltransferase n=1 Tax=unclassified Streptomyces TaxID=2593676 RepID=UPI000DB9414F|nr:MULTISPECIES: GNAT family N-acetyltransferase [unclassified Streptomyces]MYT71285.1 GNAT family N-acetyltransferase [Streptomyces sp. SID8367]RAJ82738.1 putative acetyltransferase [Streptomyces sp. PsTaAH-137]